MDDNTLVIVRVRVKINLPGQKWSNRTVVMSKAGELVAILPETDYTENMTLVEDEHWSKGLSDMERATEVDPEMDDLGW